MKAIRIHQFGEPEVMQPKAEVPNPVVGAGQALVQIHCLTFPFTRRQ
jgi:NADPH:quinone reductase-like Zn-dependent oxidoreductase